MKREDLGSRLDHHGFSRDVWNGTEDGGKGVRRCRSQGPRRLLTISVFFWVSVSRLLSPPGLR